jgi:hypothetical protein
MQREPVDDFSSPENASRPKLRFNEVRLTVCTRADRKIACHSNSD